MNDLFLFLLLIALLALVIGLINPKFVVCWGETCTRGRAALVYGVAVIVLFIAFGMTSKPITSTVPAPVGAPAVQPVTEVKAPVEAPTQPVSAPAPQQAQTPTSPINIDGHAIMTDFSKLGIVFSSDTIAGQPYIKGVPDGTQASNIEMAFFNGLDNCPSIMLTLHGVDKTNLLYLSMLMQDALPGYNSTNLFTKSINSVDNEQSEIYGDRIIKMQYSSTGLFIVSINQNKS